MAWGVSPPGVIPCGREAPRAPGQSKGPPFFPPWLAPIPTGASSYSLVSPGSLGSSVGMGVHSRIRLAIRIEVSCSLGWPISLASTVEVGIGKPEGLDASTLLASRLAWCVGNRAFPPLPPPAASAVLGERPGVEQAPWACDYIIFYKYNII